LVFRFPYTYGNFSPGDFTWFSVFTEPGCLEIGDPWGESHSSVSFSGCIVLRDLDSSGSSTWVYFWRDSWRLIMASITPNVENHWFFENSKQPVRHYRLRYINYQVMKLLNTVLPLRLQHRILYIWRQKKSWRVNRRQWCL
jgi:hypothetical protein